MKVYGEQTWVVVPQVAEDRVYVQSDKVKLSLLPKYQVSLKHFKIKG